MRDENGHLKQSNASCHLQLVYGDVRQVIKEVGIQLQKLSGKTLLLTGANGFLASYMADTIASLNDSLLRPPCLLVALVHSRVDGRRLGHLVGRNDVQFLEQDVNDPIHLDQHVDYIVHAASKASPKDYLSHPFETMDANVIATRQLLELAKNHRVESFLFLSSSEIYGDTGPTLTQISETFPGMIDPLSPRACYTESKRFGETLCAFYWRQYRVPTKIARPFHIYGPGMRLDDGRVIPDFLCDRLEERPIRVLSDGTARRAFCYVSDATAGFWRLLLSDQNGEAFNIGNDKEPILIRDLAYLIARLCQPELPVYVEKRGTEYLRGSPSSALPDIGKAMRQLGYFPRTSLSDGLTRMLEWYLRIKTDEMI